MKEKSQLFVIVEFQLINIEGMGERKSPLGKHHSNNYYRQGPSMAAKIKRQKKKEKQDI